MRRVFDHSRAYLAAFLVSLLLHGGLLALFFVSFYRPSTHPTQPSPSEWVIVEVVPVPPQAEAPQPAAPAEASPPHRTKRPKKAKPETPAPSAATVPDDAPRANAAEALVPKPTLTLIPDEQGRTLLPGDPSLLPRELSEEERVKLRVDRLTSDGIAQARAQGGVPHPYFASVREVARAELVKAARDEGRKPTATQAMGGVGHNYAESVGKYGESGDPGLAPSSTPARTPAAAGNNNANEITGGMAQGAETQLALARSRPLVTLTVELRQFKDGSPLSAVILHASGDPGFDTFVTQTWAKALAARPPPPDSAFRGPELRSIWSVEGWLGLPKKLETAASYLPVPMAAERLIGAMSKEGFHWEFRTKLLRVY